MNLIELLEKAIEDELKEMHRYKEYAQNAPDPDSRLLFEQLAREEQVHHKRLSDKLKAVKLLQD